MVTVTRHGRATHLQWKTVVMSTTAGRRNATENELIERLREIIPEQVRTTILADRSPQCQRSCRIARIELTGHRSRRERARFG